MMPSSKVLVRLITQIAFVGVTLHAARAGDEPDGNATQKLLLSLQPVTKLTASRLPSTIRWRGQDYDVESAIVVLMAVGRDPESSSKDRELALSQLRMLRTHLSGRPCLDELKARFDDVGELEKRITLTCFIGARDPRAIPLCIHVLDNEQAIKLRLSAASWLAQWNIRRGVAELIDLVELFNKLPRPPTFQHGGSPLAHFRTTNARKGWGFPSNDWWTAIDSRSDLDEDQRKVLRNVAIEKEIKAIKEWFSENEHRFPDWKPGDPLPDVQIPEKSDR